LSAALGAAFVALGTNVPHGGLSGAALLAAALAELEDVGLKVLRRSAIWETTPWPPSDQAPFLNSVVELDCGGRTPQSLFDQLNVIERRFGRVRRARWGPRTLDLDVLDFGGLVGEYGAISLPHKRLHERAFVLAPMAEIAPEWRHPVSGLGAAALLEGVDPRQAVRRAGEFGRP
jgi:2-amino-4-hydroxy-6-hydroxymethyldihydropteridine diphosphokinase